LTTVYFAEMEYLRENEIRDLPLIFVKAQAVVTMKESTQRFWTRRAGRGRVTAS
jgi:hypothetical protein